MFKYFYCLFITFSLITSASVVNAKVYKWVDENGQVHFTNTPPPKKKITEVKISDDNGSKTNSTRSSGKYSNKSFENRLSKIERQNRDEKRKRERQERDRKYEEHSKNVYKDMCKTSKNRYRKARNRDKLNNPFTGGSYKLDSKSKRRLVKNAKEDVDLYCK